MWRWTKRLVGGFVWLLVMVAGIGFVYQWAATRRDLAATPPPGRLVDVGGHRLHVWCTGSGWPAVIHESGLGGGAFAWVEIKPDVARFTQVCTYDRAGIGYSDPGPMPRTSRQIATELAALLEGGGVEPPVILVAAIRAVVDAARDPASGLLNWSLPASQLTRMSCH